MASDSLNSGRARGFDAARLVHTLLPGLLLVLLVTALTVAAVLGLRSVLGTEITATHERHFVFRRLEDPLYLGARYPLWRGIFTVLLVGLIGVLSTRFLVSLRRGTEESTSPGWMGGMFFAGLGCVFYLALALWLLLTPGGSGYAWLHVLVPVLIGGIVYLAWMYVRDSRSVGWPWAAFLATLRASVYCLVSLVFLLPAWQNWEKLETHSKAVILLDASGSMSSRDDLPTESMPPEKLPTRLDKVIRLLTDEETAFLKTIQEKNPLTLYRFGGILDEEVRLLEGGEVLSEAGWSAWLKLDPKAPLPEIVGDEEKAKLRKRQELHRQLVEATNLGDVLVAAVNREANNMVQGIIVFSDGRSTQYSSQAFEELRARARKAKVPIFMVAVGEHRQPIKILITDLQAPEQARPDDKFPVRVEVDGEGLPEQEATVYLEVTNARGEKRSLEKTLRFSPGSGGPPHGQAEFEIDPATLGTPNPDSKTPELEEGEWVFRARVPRDKREVFLEKEHLSNPASVQVVKKPLRVLLFAAAPTRDYQFVRSLFVREVDRRRAELSICLQFQREGVVQDVPQDRLLRQFPNQFQAEDAPLQKAEDRYYNLAQYDLIIAFDPDWTQLQPDQMALLERWVGTHAGGLIVVGGPVNTYQLARPGNRDSLKPLIDLYPVFLQDSRLHGLALDRSTTEPWRLHFPGATSEMEFLKLEEEGKDPLAGWEEFFTGRARNEGGGKVPLQRGFFNYYPVESVKPSAAVIATFSDPRARLSSDHEQPYLVSMPYGSGKVVYISSGETWRLRFREAFHERFWTKLARYVGSSKLGRVSRGVLVMGQEFTAGQYVRLEAQLFGRDLQPLNRTVLPKVRLAPPAGAHMAPAYELQAKPGAGGSWDGWFQGRFLVNAPGEYRLELQIPETGETLLRKFLVKEANPELDNTRPDFGQLYQLAGEVTDALPRIRDKQAQNQLLQALEAVASSLLPGTAEKASPERPRTRPEPVDRGEPSEAAGRDKDAPRLFFDLRTARLIPLCLTADSRVQRNRGPFEDLWDRGFVLSEHGLFGSPWHLSYLLLTVVMLLSMEWLTRKLLKLA